LLEIKPNLKEKKMSHKLADSAIGQIAKCVQVAILTGTDVVDHLRQLELEVNDKTITVSEGYLSTFNENIERMLQDAATAAEQTSDEANENTTRQVSLFS